MLYIRRTEMTEAYKDGGLQAADTDSIKLKINWLKSFLHNKSFWYRFPRKIFQKLAGIKFLLKCDFNILKPPVDYPCLSSRSFYFGISCIIIISPRQHAHMEQ